MRDARVKNREKNRENPRNLNIPGIQPTDGRQLDILATGLGSIPLCADVTLRSPLSALDFPHDQKNLKKKPATQEPCYVAY